MKKKLLDKLSINEATIIEMIRDSKFHSITVTKRDGNIVRLESIERISDVTEIADVLSEHNFQNIELKQANGRIVCLNRTIKTKLN